MLIKNFKFILVYLLIVEIFLFYKINIFNIKTDKYNYFSRFFFKFSFNQLERLKKFIFSLN